MGALVRRPDLVCHPLSMIRMYLLAFIDTYSFNVTAPLFIDINYNHLKIYWFASHTNFPALQLN